MAAPPPPIPKPVVLPFIQVERHTWLTDSLKRYVTATMPVFSAADMTPQALDTLNAKGVTLPANKGVCHLVWHYRPRHWTVARNNYFTGRVPVPALKVPAIVTHTI
ncbi:hypothetical protein BXP70_28620 [Hymenobacter crusticola]|uniref:Uncharacterized protein n=2 Tax=Hymenobacter crusticola TaxID=1770526 RepID=A0A243W6K3_9BACT|nr:hypothetical protein BXP70_28620 [Hymenobacter crusticola]